MQGVAIDVGGEGGGVLASDIILEYYYIADETVPKSAEPP